jgi:hypothetical protein
MRAAGRRRNGPVQSGQRFVLVCFLTLERRLAEVPFADSGSDRACACCLSANLRVAKAHGDIWY